MLPGSRLELDGLSFHEAYEATRYLASRLTQNSVSTLLHPIEFSLGTRAVLAVNRSPESLALPLPSALVSICSFSATSAERTEESSYSCDRVEPFVLLSAHPCVLVKSLMIPGTFGTLQAAVRPGVLLSFSWHSQFPVLSTQLS
jgi:hypothetical protein